MIARNTTNAVVRIKDLGLTINPFESISLDSVAAHERALSNDLPTRIADGTLIINHEKDLSVAESLRLIYGEDIEPRDWTGKMFYHPTSRPFGTKVHFTGAGDFPDAVSDIGSGIAIEIHHNVGDLMVQTLYSDFNTISNLTHIQEGQLQCWKAMMDKVSVEFVPRIVTFTMGSNTPYLYDPSQPIVLPSIIIGGAGNVDINEDISQANGGLVQALENEAGVKPPAFWTADYNSQTGIFENIQPAPTGNGDYNLFHVEYALARFANRVGMVGTSVITFTTDDTDPIPHGVRLKSTWETAGEDHEWAAITTFKMHRAKSC